MALQKKKEHEFVTLQASTAVLVDGNGDSVRLPGMVNAFGFRLEVTAAATDAQDLLDVYVQTKLDGTNWVDVAHFTQVTGTTTTPARYHEKVVAQLAQTGFAESTALGAAAVRHLLGDEWRVRWDVTEAGPPGPTSGSGVGLLSFTFSVTAIPM